MANQILRDFPGHTLGDKNKLIDKSADSDNAARRDSMQLDTAEDEAGNASAADQCFTTLTECDKRKQSTVDLDDKESDRRIVARE